LEDRFLRLAQGDAQPRRARTAGSTEAIQRFEMALTTNATSQMTTSAIPPPSTPKKRKIGRV
jgi:hypothetical protein